MEFSAIMNRAIAHKSKIDNTLKDYNDNLIKIDKLTKDLDTYTQALKNTELAYEYLERLINLESSKFINKLQELLTYAVRTIFFDRPDYAVDIRVSESNGATIHLTQVDSESGMVISPEIKKCGGGIKTIIGFVAQIFFINYYDAAKIIFIDEGFTQVSDIYIPYLMGFIKELCATKGFKFLLISHDTRIIPYGDKVYSIENHRSKIVKGGKSSAGDTSSTSDAAGA